jgi:23S rRNA (adenine2503-C2)-methyltransferase
MASQPAQPPPCSLLGLTRSEWEHRLAAEGVAPVHAQLIWRSLYRDLDPDPRSRPEFPSTLRHWLHQHLGHDLHPSNLQPRAQTESRNGDTHKLLFGLGEAGAPEIETVVLSYPGRNTACLSSQAGCAMGCVFCATGQMGFVRHLSAGEIVAQVVEAQRFLRNTQRGTLRNLVLMGMGEPLQNYDALMQALEIITDSMGLGIGPSRITLSTVGVVPGILRLAREKRPYGLAVSLHAATDPERSALLPINQRWPLAELLDACREYSALTQRRIFFSWTLIEGQNDSADHAQRLGSLLQGLNAHVNLIPLNPTSKFHGGPPDFSVADRFRQRVQATGLPCTIRQYRGIDVAAGCGQLSASRGRRTEAQRALPEKHRPDAPPLTLTPPSVGLADAPLSSSL